MRLVCVTPVVPHAAVGHAGGLFIHRHCSAIAARGIQVTVVAPRTVENERAAGSVTVDLPVELFEMPPEPQTAVGRFLRYSHFVRAGLSPGPGIAQGFGQPAITQALGDADIVEVYYSHFLPLVPAVRARAGSALISVIEHDVAFAAMKRRKRTARKARDRVAARLRARRMRRQEVTLLEQCDQVLVFKEEDRQTLGALGLDLGRIAVLQPALDEPRHESPPPPGGQRVLFVGAMGRDENVEAVEWFLTEVWPLVRRRCPRASFVVAGANPPAFLRHRRDVHVTVTGWVPDLERYYRDADVVVAPLCAGSGLKFKVPQAMVYGRPVVATLVAAEGVASLAPHDVLGAVTASPTAFAEAVSGLLADPVRAERVGASASAWARGTYCFERGVDEVLARYAELRSAGSACRAGSADGVTPRSDR